MRPTTIFFIRHGEVYNPRDIVYLRSPRFRLSERGVQEAGTTAKFLRREPIRGIYTSPMLRARQTAQIIQREHPNAPIRVSKYINELRSAWQGKTRAEVEAAIDWNFYDNRKRPDDETREDVLARVQKLLRLTLNRHAGEAVVWVSHGDIVISTMVWGRGELLTAMSKYRGATYISHASVVKFVFEPGRELPVSVEYFDPNKA